jgi:CheY-like chemotaxis protein
VDNGEATIAVTDNGIGIEPDLLPKVFDLFEQGNRSLDRSQGGLGVGLTLAQRLVELHNGRIEARSTGAGRGSEFRVILPCLTEVQPAATRPQAIDTAGAKPTGCKVLVVDDNHDAAQTVAAFLELAGHGVRAVTDGAQALACVADFGPNVVVLDIGLPGIDGFQLARRLRETAETKGALLIAVTGYGQESDRQRAVDAGFDHYLVKPASPSELSQLIADWRAAAAARAALAVVG